MIHRDKIVHTTAYVVEHWMEQDSEMGPPGGIDLMACCTVSCIPLQLDKERQEYHLITWAKF